MCCLQDPLVLAQLPEASRRSRPFYSKGLFYCFTWMLVFSFLHARKKRVMPSAGRQGMDGLWMMEDGAARHEVVTGTRTGTEWSIPSGCVTSTGKTKARSLHILHQPDGNQVQN